MGGLQAYLDSTLGEVFHDAQENFLTDNCYGDCAKFHTKNGWVEDSSSPGGLRSEFSVYPTRIECRETTLQTPPPPTGPYKRRKITKPIPYEGGVDISHTESTAEATQHRDVLILFRFNDHDLPFKLRQIIMSDLRLLTLLESGLPSWVIFLQSYPLFFHLYRPWMCLVARAFYVLISVVTVVIGFYDLYKNVPVLKATVSIILFGSHPAVMELVEVILPFWNGCFQAVESFLTVIWVLIDSSCGLVQMLLSPVWFILRVIGSIVSCFNSVLSCFCFIIVYPIIWTIQEILYTPIHLLLVLASFVAYIFSCIIEFVREIWLFASSIFQLKSATEAGTYEIYLWGSLWNDLFSQVFRATRSITNGFVAFFVACNRHRLSIYNYMQDFFLRLSCLAGRNRTMNFNYRRRCGAQDQVMMKQMQLR
ncbi:hypothetical protein MKX01_021669 [Papaver californicum]|nr:hypothetical protein MKX01_021669 [Papaver californicum]